MHRPPPFADFVIADPSFKDAMGKSITYSTDAQAPSEDFMCYKKTILITISILVLSVQAVFAGGSSDEASNEVTIWTKYNSENPENDRDEWMKSAIEAYLEETGGVINNIFVPYDQINSKLNVAISAGGDIPDLSYIDSQQQAFYVSNATLMDITDLVVDASWYKEMSPRALDACTAPDGSIIAVPLNIGTRVSYIWTEAWPNGYPSTVSGFLAEAARIREEGSYAMTFKASEKYGTEGLYYGLVKSFGGSYADEEGNAAWANPEMVAVLEYLRILFAEEYVPEIDLAPGFDNERPFVQGDAVSFPGISWSYVYMNPLTAPDGTVIDEGSSSIAKAVEMGKIDVAPYLSADDGEPVAALTSSALAIPDGAGNIDGALAFINWLMTPERNAECAAALGGLPSIISAQSSELFQTPYWKKVSQITEEYGAPYPALVDYDRALTKLAQTFEEILSDPELDIMETLQQAQDEINK